MLCHAGRRFHLFAGAEHLLSFGAAQPWHCPLLTPTGGKSSLGVNGVPTNLQSKIPVTKPPQSVTGSILVQNIMKSFPACQKLNDLGLELLYW